MDTNGRATPSEGKSSQHLKLKSDKIEVFKEAEVPFQLKGTGW